MLASPFCCHSCQGRVSYRSFPLCEICLDSLQALYSPALCQSCAGLCGSECLRGGHGWVRAAGIASITALYLLVEPAYRVLKSWKRRRGPALDRRILRSDVKVRARLAATHAQAIVPIPQSYSRAWQLGGSPSERIAHWLARETRAPCRLLLEKPLHEGARHQAELPLSERLANPIRFEVRGAVPAGVLLVDDFMTTGSTLRAAALALRQGGASEIHVFCLGMRPRLERS